MLYVRSISPLVRGVSDVYLQLQGVQTLDTCVDWTAGPNLGQISDHAARAEINLRLPSPRMSD
jgi:hypothetical protein